jgi:cupin 2 domain-containing protein
VANLFDPIPAEVTEELFQVLLETGDFRLGRIVSTGQATPPGEWYDQDDHEWVVLLSGGAGLRFEDEPKPRVLSPGDYLLIPAHRRHRVEWTDPEAPTVWLALHYVQ